MLGEISMAGGFAAGLASSLHCVGMCGGIASSLTLSLSPDGSRTDRARVLLLAQLGRVISYTLAGAALAAIGTSIYFGFDRAEAHLVMRWAGALVLVYIGLSVMGWAPALSGLDRFGRGIHRLIGARFGGAFRAASPVLAGLVWGLLPCGMVYAVLLYALLSGSAVSGALVMLGFGLGTLPAVTAAALGLTQFLALARRPGTRYLVGATIVVIGFASAAIPWRALAALCGIQLD